MKIVLGNLVAVLAIFASPAVGKSNAHHSNSSHHGMTRAQAAKQAAAIRWIDGMLADAEKTSEDVYNRDHGLGKYAEINKQNFIKYKAIQDKYRNCSQYLRLSSPSYVQDQLACDNERDSAMDAGGFARESDEAAGERAMQAYDRAEYNSRVDSIYRDSELMRSGVIPTRPYRY